MADTPKEEPCLASRYVGNGEYKVYIVGRNSRNVLVNKPFDDETAANPTFRPMKEAWDKAHPKPKSETQP